MIKQTCEPDPLALALPPFPVPTLTLIPLRASTGFLGASSSPNPPGSNPPLFSSAYVWHRPITPIGVMYRGFTPYFNAYANRGVTPNTLPRSPQQRKYE